MCSYRVNPPLSVPAIAPRDAVGHLQPSAVAASITTVAPATGRSQLVDVTVAGQRFRFAPGTSENTFVRQDIVGFDRGDDLVQSRLPGHLAADGLPTTLVAEQASRRWFERLNPFADGLRELAIFGLVRGSVVELNRFRPTLAHGDKQGDMAFVGYVSARLPVALESTVHELAGQRVQEFAVLVLDLVSGEQFNFHTMDGAIAQQAARDVKLDRNVLTIGDQTFSIR